MLENLNRDHKYSRIGAVRLFYLTTVRYIGPLFLPSHSGTLLGISNI